MVLVSDHIAEGGFLIHHFVSQALKGEKIHIKEECLLTFHIAYVCRWSCRLSSILCPIFHSLQQYCGQISEMFNIDFMAVVYCNWFHSRV